MTQLNVNLTAEVKNFKIKRPSFDNHDRSWLLVPFSTACPVSEFSFIIRIFLN